MPDERPTFGSLFAGIGGIDLGLERAGWRGRWQVEYEPFCQRVLAKHWPDVTRYGDIHDVDWSGVERVDLVAGGFPCQPVSYAGRGLAQDDVRWLWPEFERALRTLRPRYVLVENVPGLLRRGLGDVLGGLASLGYDAEWDCIPAAAVGAPHLRDRVWIVAYADGLRQGRTPALGSPGLTGLRASEAGPEPDGPGAGTLADPDRGGLGWTDPADEVNGPALHGDGSSRNVPRSGSVSMADAERSGLQGRSRSRESGQGRASSEPASRGQALADAKRGRWDGRAPDPERIAQQRASSGGSGTAGGWSDQWLTEPDVGRVAHGVPARVDRLRSLGNAVVPQVVEFIGRRILEAEALT